MVALLINGHKPSSLNAVIQILVVLVPCVPRARLCLLPFRVNETTSLLVAGFCRWLKHEQVNVGKRLTRRSRHQSCLLRALTSFSGPICCAACRLDSAGGGRSPPPRRKPIRHQTERTWPTYNPPWAWANGEHYFFKSSPFSCANHLLLLPWQAA